MLFNISIGLLLVTATVLIHSILSYVILKLIHKRQTPKKHKSRLTAIIFIDLVVLLIVFAAFIEAVIWGCSFYLLGALDNVFEAIYFSIVTLTTLGYGDITLSSEWRILASFEAIVGVVMFGWSTALLMSAIGQGTKNH